MKSLPWLLAVPLVVWACAGPRREERANAVILDHPSIDAVLNQCSRDTPPAGKAAPPPTWGEINALEAQLPAALIAHAKALPELAGPTGEMLSVAGQPTSLRGELRQYVGYVRNGRRYIYGNFFPEAFAARDWRKQPVVYCDGGPAHFGVEFDVQAQRITHIAFNG